MFDRAAEHGNQVVEFFGTQLTLPPEGRFASVGSAQRYVDEVLGLVGVDSTIDGAGAPRRDRCALRGHRWRSHDRCA